ncbi:MAG: hypothetical protein ACK6EB_17240, partial [Planctomyces sp.]
VADRRRLTRAQRRLANQAGRATVHNGTAPSPPSLPEPDVADMEYFLSQLHLVLPVLGFAFLQSKPVASPASTATAADESPLFCLNAVGAEARAREINGGFVVLP